MGLTTESNTSGLWGNLEAYTKKQPFPLDWGWEIIKELRTRRRHSPANAEIPTSERQRGCHKTHSPRVVTKLVRSLWLTTVCTGNQPSGCGQTGALRRAAGERRWPESIAGACLQRPLEDRLNHKNRDLKPESSMAITCRTTRGSLLVKLSIWSAGKVA